MKGRRLNRRSLEGGGCFKSDDECSYKLLETEDARRNKTTANFLISQDSLNEPIRGKGGHINEKDPSPVKHPSSCQEEETPERLQGFGSNQTQIIAIRQSKERNKSPFTIHSSEEESISKGLNPSQISPPATHLSDISRKKTKANLIMSHDSLNEPTQDGGGHNLDRDLTTVAESATKLVEKMEGACSNQTSQILMKRQSIEHSKSSSTVHSSEESGSDILKPSSPIPPLANYPDHHQFGEYLTSLSACPPVPRVRGDESSSTDDLTLYSDDSLNRKNSSAASQHRKPKRRMSSLLSLRVSKHSCDSLNALRVSKKSTESLIHACEALRARLQQAETELARRNSLVAARSCSCCSCNNSSITQTPSTTTYNNNHSAVFPRNPSLCCGSSCEPQVMMNGPANSALTALSSPSICPRKISGSMSLPTVGSPSIASCRNYTNQCSLMSPPVHSLLKFVHPQLNHNSPHSAFASTGSAEANTGGQKANGGPQHPRKSLTTKFWLAKGIIKKDHATIVTQSGDKKIMRRISLGPLSASSPRHRRSNASSDSDSVGAMGVTPFGCTGFFIPASKMRSSVNAGGSASSNAGGSCSRRRSSRGQGQQGEVCASRRRGSISDWIRSLHTPGGGGTRSGDLSENSSLCGDSSTIAGWTKDLKIIPEQLVLSSKN